MGAARRRGLDLNAPSSESLLKSIPLHSLLILRDECFVEALSPCLACEGDVLISRRDSWLKPLQGAEDITSLLNHRYYTHIMSMYG